MGSRTPVMRMSAGATSAESTPPAPKSDQKMGSWDLVMSHPAHDGVDEDRGGHGGRAPAGGNQNLGERPATDAKIRRRLGRDLPPGEGVIADGREGAPVKQDRPRAGERRPPPFVRVLPLRQLIEADEKDDRVGRE